MSKTYSPTLQASTLAILLALNCATPPLARSESQPLNTQFSLGIGVMSEALLLMPEGYEAQNSLTPSISLGVGISTQLNSDWEWEGTLSVEHAHTELLATPSASSTQHLSLMNTGVWAGSSLKYTAFAEDMRPFLALEVGKVHASLDTPEGHRADWGNAYRAGVGMEFDLAQGRKFSIALMAGESETLN